MPAEPARVGPSAGADELPQATVRRAEASQQKIRARTGSFLASIGRRVSPEREKISAGASFSYSQSFSSAEASMRTVMVRYKTSDAQAETNAGLVRAVFEELAQRTPGGLHYATYRLADGVTFVHLATLDVAGQNPLQTLPAFQAFQENIKARCVEPPVVSELSLVGSYGMPWLAPGPSAEQA
jgi:hypothetical protein